MDCLVAPLHAMTGFAEFIIGRAFADPLARDGDAARRPLPHHAGNKPGLAPRRLDFLFQEAMGFATDISRPDVGPGPAFGVGGAVCLAGLLAVALLHLEAAIVAARTVDRGLHRLIARLDDSGAAYTRDAAIIGLARRHAVLEPAHRAGLLVGRITETPCPAATVTLAQKRTFLRIAGRDR